MLYLLLLLTISNPTPNTVDTDWPRFRGPNGSGIAESGGLPVQLGPDKNVVWELSLPPGHSSPVVLGPHIFLTAFEDQRVSTFAIDRMSGEIVWRRDVEPERSLKSDRRNNAASPTPAVDNDTVVVFFEDVGLIAYDHDGLELWRVLLGPFNNVYGMGASPVLHGNTVFLPCDQSTKSFLIAVHKLTGKILWKKDRPWAKSGHCTPVVYEPENGEPQLLLPGSFSLDAYDMRSGERIWWVDGLAVEMKSTPVLLDGVLYINGYTSPLNQPGNQVKLPPFDKVIADADSNKDGLISQTELPPSRASAFFEFVDLDSSGGLDQEEWRFFRSALASQNGMLAMKVGGNGDMTEKNMIWSYRRSVPQLPSPLVCGETLYMLNDQSGLITTLRPDSGELIERGRLKDAADSYYASPVAGDSKVYLVSENGLVTVLAADDGLEPLAVNDLQDTCYATPAIVGKYIYIRTSSRLYCFGLPD